MPLWRFSYETVPFRKTPRGLLCGRHFSFQRISWQKTNTRYLENSLDKNNTLYSTITQFLLCVRVQVWVMIEIHQHGSQGPSCFIEFVSPVFYRLHPFPTMIFFSPPEQGIPILASRALYMLILLLRGLLYTYFRLFTD